MNCNKLTFANFDIKCGSNLGHDLCCSFSAGELVLKMMSRHGQESPCTSYIVHGFNMRFSTSQAAQNTVQKNPRRFLPLLAIIDSLLGSRTIGVTLHRFVSGPNL